MFYFLFFIIGLAGGAFCMFLLVQYRYRKATEEKRSQHARKQKLEQELHELTEKRKRFEAVLNEFKQRIASYEQLQGENTILKRDLRNIDVGLRKSQLDVQVQARRQKELDERVNTLCWQYVKDSIKWLTKSLTQNNFVSIKERLIHIIEGCRRIGFDIPNEQETVYVSNLKEEFEKIVRAAYQREEQARIKAQIREQQKLEREIEREIAQLDREKVAIQAALDRALAEAEDKHSDEVERLRARLAEAEAKAERAKSMAEMTKAGHVYVLSNIGSFGDGVYKIGMTRRLEPEMRVRELSSASVPFPYDVHMMISCDDAPSLENALHKAFHQARLNRVNPRKEFFRTDIEEVHRIVQQHHGQVDYIADAEALEYHQSLTVSEIDSEFIDSIYEDMEEEGEATVED